MYTRKIRTLSSILGLMVAAVCTISSSINAAEYPGVKQTKFDARWAAAKAAVQAKRSARIAAVEPLEAYKFAIKEEVEKAISREIEQARRSERSAAKKALEEEKSRAAKKRSCIIS